MDAATAEAAVKLFLDKINGRLAEAARIAKAASACAESGNAGKGVEVAMDIEQLCYDANRFLGAASLINRCARE